MWFGTYDDVTTFSGEDDVVGWKNCVAFTDDVGDKCDGEFEEADDDEDDDDDVFNGHWSKFFGVPLIVIIDVDVVWPIPVIPGGVNKTKNKEKKKKKINLVIKYK